MIKQAKRPSVRNTSRKHASQALSPAEAFLFIERKAFVPSEFASLATSDIPLPLGGGRVMLQPSVVRVLVEMLAPEPGQIILVIGAGSGYVPALLGAMVGETGRVIAFEEDRELAALAKENLEKFSLLRQGVVELRAEDGFRSLTPHAPYHAILACGTLPEGSASSTDLLDALSPGGRLIYPSGEWLCMAHKNAFGASRKQTFKGFSFAPLKG
ncbi:MAG: hypothetical protein WDN67_04310 [Candidatus Moraniibacteriota bacterium]